MRHRKKINHLGRTSSHRKAMLANMASSLIMYKRISTTTAKAKALRIYVEPILTKSKEDTTHSRRIVFSYLKNKVAVGELFREIAQKIAGRPGGYTRILKTGSRLGDNADMCIIELVDYNENMLAAASESKAPAKRSRRGKKKSDATVAEAVFSPKEKKAVKEPAKNEKTTEAVGEVTSVEDATLVQEEAPVVVSESTEPGVIAEDISEIKEAGENEASDEEMKPVAKKNVSKKDDGKKADNKNETD